MKLDSQLLIASALVLSSFLSACDRMDSTYIDFVKDGERNYAQRADSVVIRSGHNRVEVSFMLISDPRVSSATIYWNNRTDSVAIDIERIAGIDTVKHIIADLAEGSYFFEIVTYDRYGAKSITVSRQGTVYGQRYLSGLLDRPVVSAEREDDEVKIDFGAAQADVVGSEVQYTSDGNLQKTIFVPASQEALSILDHKVGEPLRYRTLFLPDSLALDTAYSDFMEVRVLSLLDKSKFSRWNHVSAPYFPLLAYLPTTYEIESMWDNGAYNNNNYGFYWESPVPMDMAFTFDMGVTAAISKFVIQPQTLYGWLYSGGNPKNFEVWGTNDPNPESDLSTWDFIGSYQSHKPSGLPLGAVTDADAVFAEAGEEFVVVGDVPPVRYLRFVIHDTWGNTAYFHITELTLWGIINSQ